VKEGDEKILHFYEPEDHVTSPIIFKKREPQSAPVLFQLSHIRIIEQ
jgi:hypothetical protein